MLSIIIYTQRSNEITGLIIYLMNSIYNIKYENLVSLILKNEIKKILSFCDLDWSDDCLNFHNNKRPIKTASDTQARSKIYSIASIESWKNYENQFA